MNKIIKHLIAWNYEENYGKTGDIICIALWLINIVLLNYVIKSLKEENFPIMLKQPIVTELMTTVDSTFVTLSALNQQIGTIMIIV